MQLELEVGDYGLDNLSFIFFPLPHDFLSVFINLWQIAFSSSYIKDLELLLEFLCLHVAIINQLSLIVVLPESSLSFELRLVPIFIFKNRFVLFFINTTLLWFVALEG